MSLLSRGWVRLLLGSLVAFLFCICFLLGAFTGNSLAGAVYQYDNHRYDGYPDFNGDGKTDPLRTEAGKWWVSYGGTSVWVQVGISSYTLSNMAFGDFNGDGKTDIFATGGGEWLVSYGGASGWTHLNTSGSALSSLAFGDFNGDGKTDVFRTGAGEWLVSYGGTSAWTHLNTSGYELSSLAFGDFDGDGKTDVLRTGVGGWLVSYGGTSGWTHLLVTSGTLSMFAFGDFDGDGKTDGFQTAGGTWWVAYTGSSFWTSVNTSSYLLAALSFADFNGDGKTDVYRSSGDGWAVSFAGTSGWTQLNPTGPAPPTSHTLTTSVPGGGGSITRNPDQASYNVGSTVTLTAVPETGYTFTGWGGDASGTANPLVLTMDANKTVTATFTLTPPVPPCPTLICTPGDGQITLDWNAVSGADSYSVYVDGIPIMFHVPFTGTQFVHTVTNGVQHCYRVTAWVGSQQSTGCSQVCCTAQEVSCPTLTCTPGDGQITLDWNAVSGADYYNVYVDGNPVMFVVPFTGTQFVDTVTNGVQHCYRVTAVVGGQESTGCTEVCCTAQEVPCPTGLDCTSGDGQVQVSWAAVSGATGYNVYRDGVKVNSALLTSTSYLDTGLTNGTQYCYQVRAVVGGQESTGCARSCCTPQGGGGTPTFSDVPATHPYYVAIMDLASRGIITGFGDGTFGPGKLVTRQQFAKMIVLAGGYAVSASDICPFGDVALQQGSDPLYPSRYVAVAAARGITLGKTATSFDPYSNITRYQVISMVVRAALDLDPGLLSTPPSGWTGSAGWGSDPTHGANALRAEYGSLLAGLNLTALDPYGSMTRGEVAQVLYNLLGKL